MRIPFRRAPWVFLSALLAWTACTKTGTDPGATNAAVPAVPDTALAPGSGAPQTPGQPAPAALPPGWAPPPGPAGTARPAAPPETPRAGPEPVNALLFSWDGLDRSVVKELLAKGSLPNLAALIREGSLQDIDVRGHATVTKPGHAEMLTGLGPETTGVYTNQRYRPIPAGLTIFERLQDRFGGPERIRTFMVTGKVAHVGGRGPGDIPPAAKKGAGKKGLGKKGLGKKALVPPGADDSPEKEIQGEPFFVTKRRLDVFDAAQRDADEVGPLALEVLGKFKAPRFCAFVHFGDPDHAGHGHGAASAEYRQAAVLCDAWLGKIRAWLKEQGLDGKTLVYVMADHGFDMPAGFSHNRAPASWLATNDPAVVRGGTIADVPATILERLGVDLPKLDPPLLGKPLTKPAAK